jgi:predicted PurR-regulated permease PerM
MIKETRDPVQKTPETERLATSNGRAVKARSGRVGASDNWRTVGLGAAILVCGLGALAVIWLLRRPLALLVFGVVVAEALAPVVDWLERKLPRVAAVLLVYLALLLVLAGVLYVVVPAFIDQAQTAIGEAPGMIQRAQSWLAHRNLPISQGIGSMLSQQLAGLAGSLLTLPLTVFSSVFDLFLVIFISIYWLIQLPSISRFVLSLVPTARQERLKHVSYEMGSAMGGYLRGTAIDGLILGTATFIGLSLLGVDYPLVLGLVTGLLEFVPVLGAIGSVVLIVLVALGQSLTLALMALVFALVLQQIENHILVPNVMHSQTDISPLLAVLAVFAGGTLLGVLGALISIPVASALQVFVKEVVAPAVRRRTGAEAVQETGHA